VKELRRIENTLRFRWDLARYGAAHRPVANDADYASVDVSVVDDAIKSSKFWGSLRVLDSFAELLLKAFSWAEGCSCRSHVDSQAVPRELAERWASCPMRGRRAPDLANGSFFIFFNNLSQMSAADLLAQLPHDLKMEDRAFLLQEFERGRAHLVFAFTLRLAHWRSPPWCVCGCGHGDPVVARRFIRRCLALQATHSLLQELQHDPVRSEAERFVDGEDIFQLRNLQQYVGSLAFAITAERTIEGDHAQVSSS
jgi:hypothetical protein